MRRSEGIPPIRLLSSRRFKVISSFEAEGLASKALIFFDCVKSLNHRCAWQHQKQMFFYRLII